MTRVPAALLVALLVASASAACAAITPAVPRFVAVYDQQSSFCRIQVVRDTRTVACFVTFKCARQAVQVVPVAPDVCVP